MNDEFEWDLEKDLSNRLRHGYSFEEAVEIFSDPQVIHVVDAKHSSRESRYLAVGRCENGDILTVRYTKRGGKIRIFGAASWRKWKKFYEENTRS